MKTGANTYSSAIIDAKNYTSWIVSLFQSYLGDKILEVGLGHGGYRAFLKNVDYTGADIDIQCIEHAKRSDPNGKYYQADLAASSFSETVGNDFDSILCCNVLEHIKDDDLALTHLLSALRPGGHLLLLVPSHELLYSDMDKLAGHHRRYSRRMLLRRLPEGIIIKEVRYINPVGALGWFANRFASHNDLDTENINRQIIFFDRYVLPFTKVLGGLTGRFFGQSLICVVQK
ncbi:MAG: class I SAM-dependent methyltransferase [Hyphomicrobiales bacterium]